MKMKIQKNTTLWNMFRELWVLTQEYWIVENSNNYAEEMTKAFISFGEKYQGLGTLFAIAFIEEKSKELIILEKGE